MSEYARLFEQLHHADRVLSALPGDHYALAPPGARAAASIEALEEECLSLSKMVTTLDAALAELEAENERLRDALQAFVDQLDSEELGEPGLGAADWIAHWQGMHDAARAALASKEQTDER